MSHGGASGPHTQHLILADVRTVSRAPSPGHLSGCPDLPLGAPGGCLRGRRAPGGGLSGEDQHRRPQTTPPSPPPPRPSAWGSDSSIFSVITDEEAYKPRDGRFHTSHWE